MLLSDTLKFPTPSIWVRLWRRKIHHLEDFNRNLLQSSAFGTAHTSAKVPAIVKIISGTPLSKLSKLQQDVIFCISVRHSCRVPRDIFSYGKNGRGRGRVDKKKGGGGGWKVGKGELRMIRLGAWWARTLLGCSTYAVPDLGIWPQTCDLLSGASTGRTSRNWPSDGCQSKMIGCPALPLVQGPTVS